MPRRLSPLRYRQAIVLGCVSVLIGLVSGCAEVPGSSPWVDSRRESGTDQRVGLSTLDNPAICYADNSQWKDVLALAEKECARTHRHAVSERVDDWQCRVITPHRAIFRCE